MRVYNQHMYWDKRQVLSILVGESHYQRGSQLAEIVEVGRGGYVDLKLGEKS